MIQWAGDFHLVVGRSRDGVNYVVAGEKIHLIVLLVVGKVGWSRHLQVLAAVADLLNNDEFREKLINASHVRKIKELLVERVGQQPNRRLSAAAIPHRSVAIAEHAVGLAESLSAQALLLALDRGQSVPWKPLESWSGRLLIITPSNSDEVVPGRADTHQIDVTDAKLSRMDRANLGLLLAAANGLVNEESEVVCITGSRGQALDSITVTRPAAQFRAVFPDLEGQVKSNIRPEVIFRVLSLAIELASEGREAHRVGATFVIGDTRQVVRQTQQLVLNPFHGFARRLRNVMDPSLAETVKEFALLDGAFIVEADGAIRRRWYVLDLKICCDRIAKWFGRSPPGCRCDHDGFAGGCGHGQPVNRNGHSIPIWGRSAHTGAGCIDAMVRLFLEVLQSRPNEMPGRAKRSQGIQPTQSMKSLLLHRSNVAVWVSEV